MTGFQGQKNKNVIFLFLISVLVLSPCFMLTACDVETRVAIPIDYQLGQVTKGKDTYGSFYFYIPTQQNEQTELLVLVHGTSKDLTPEEKAEHYVTSWQDFAAEHNYLSIAPAFNQENFSSQYGDQAPSGFRGLLGKLIDAGAWILRLAAAFQNQLEIPAEQFSPYGHFAGGQFVGRFLVTHPEVVKRAVITLAAIYPQPTADVSWPFGMGELHTEIAWDETTQKRADIVPEKEKWLAVTRIPLTVIVGLHDTAELPPELVPGQKGPNRFLIARNWVQDMLAIAETNGIESNFQIDIIPGFGHIVSGILPYSQNAFLGE